jgi:hypothetical protein
MLLVEEGEGWGSSLAVCEILSKNRPLNRRRFEDIWVKRVKTDVDMSTWTCEEEITAEHLKCVLVEGC